LVKIFVKIGPKIKDPTALQALSVSLAKLSTDIKYMTMLEKHKLLNPLAEQLFVLMEICKVLIFSFLYSLLFHNGCPFVQCIAAIFICCNYLIVYVTY
jgi:hypothetical protein